MGLMPHEGIYFFGGRDQNGRATNQLWLLKIFQSPFEFVPVESSTPLPKAKYGHCLERIEGSPYLATFGGRNDHFFKIFSHKSCFFEVDIFDVENKSWYKVKTGSYRPESRFSFCSGVQGSRLYIFGGLGDNNYISPTMEKLELDQQKVEELINLEERKKRAKRGPETEEPAPAASTNNLKIGLKLSTNRQDNTQVSSPQKTGSVLGGATDLGKGKHFDFGFNRVASPNKTVKAPEIVPDAFGQKGIIKVGRQDSLIEIEPKPENPHKGSRSYQPIPLTREGLRRYVRGVDHLPLK